MATFSHLAGWNVQAIKGSERGENGEPIENWTLVFQEQGTGNQILFAMRRESRDALVQQLTGGLVLAGGELPRL